ncbi:hypothetical protein RCL1_008798 [Eukaryota sp. TZLM3-RCL]
MPNPLTMELGKSGLASIFSTFIDMIVYFAFIRITAIVSVAAAIGSMTGGLVHYFLCRSLVFKNSTVSRAYSVFFYFFVSWTGAGLHAFLVSIFSLVFGDFSGWLTSKLLVFVTFSFPLSKYFVFGGFAPRVEKYLVSTFGNFKYVKSPNWFRMRQRIRQEDLTKFFRDVDV